MLVDRWRPIAKLLNTSPAALFLHTLPRNLHTLYLHDIHHDGMELPLRTCTFSWGHRTLHAAPAPPDAPTLKTKLRALYKRVHPDLFQQHPEAQAENSRSFKLLQEYLDTAQHGGGEAGVLVPYRFVFFLHEGDQQPLPCSEDDDQQPLPCSEDDDADNGHQRTDSDTVALRRVALVLPPPARSPRVPGTLPRAALVGLKKILEACGLESGFVLRDEDELVPGPLRVYLPQALRVMYKRAAIVRPNSAEQNLSLVRLALRHGRGVSVSVGAPLSDQNSAAQVKALEHLGKALDRCPSSIRNLHITLGDRYDVNLNGAVTLDAMDPWQAWTRWLSMELQPDKCHARAALLTRQRTLEQAVEGGLGLRMLYCLPELQGSPVYQRLLERLTSLAAAHGPLMPPPLAGPLIDVCVAPSLPSNNNNNNNNNDNNDNDNSNLQGLEVDRVKGILWLAVESGNVASAQHDALHSALCRAAPSAARAAAAKQRDAETTARLQRQVERALRLRRLVREVPMDRFSAACARLVSHAPQLMPLLESTSVVISDGFGVASDGAFVRIPWDFEV